MDAAPAPASPVRVLLIEDNPDHAYIERLALERDLGARVAVAAEPEEGLARLREADFDVVLLDYQLPGHDGLSVLTRIKAARRDLPVILITAAGSEEVAVEAMKQGASDYLVKRLSGEDLGRLAAAVRRAVERADWERRYRRAVDLLQKTLELAWDGVAYVSLATGRTLAANPSLCRMLGCEPGALDGRPFGEAFVPDERGKGERLRELLLAPGDGLGAGAAPRTEVDARLARADGTTVLAELRAVEVDVDGEACALVTARDLSDRRRLQDQLVQAQKMEAVGTLAGGIAHDFNNLLGAILGYASFLKRHMSAEGRLVNAVETIESAAERAAESVRRLLAFSRPGGSERRVFSPDALARETERLVEGWLPRSIEVAFEPGACVPAVEGDESNLQTVLVTLCANARDAMPEGGKLTIRTWRAEAGEPPAPPGSPRAARAYAVIAVRDTGSGMSREVRHRIFEPFFTTKGPGKGTGLGLATAYNIVDAHEGFLEVTSEPGQGTEVRMFLPATDREPEPRPRPADGPEEAAAGGGTILVVDDEGAIRRLACDILGERGYRVLAAGSGDEAVAILTERPGEIDLVILDIVMPGLGGIEAMRRILAVDPGARVVLSSGYSPEGAQEEGSALGAVGFISKPYRAGDLAAVVRDALARPSTLPLRGLAQDERPSESSR